MTQSSKIWFAGMSGPNSLEDLKELLEPIKHCFAGIVWVLHNARDSEEAKYLESIKGEGKIIHYYYSGRHDASRNQYLWCGPIQQGDWVVTCDGLERINPDFALSLSFFLSHWEKQGANCIYYYGKPLAFKYHESMVYVGTPHEGLQRQDGQMRAVEISDAYPNEADVRLNVRPQKRDSQHFIKHYARYSLMVWGANHYRLGLEGKSNARELFMERELGRLKFIELLRELGIKRNVDAVIEYLKQPAIDQRVRAHISKDKIWNDVYRFYVLGRQDFKDDHDWNNVISVDIPVIPA